eukprot:SAG31_NODE_3584_length_4100_cov_1.957761_6_plen_111_part_00
MTVLGSDVDRSVAVGRIHTERSPFLLQKRAEFVGVAPSRLRVDLLRVLRADGHPVGAQRAGQRRRPADRFGLGGSAGGWRGRSSLPTVKCVSRRRLQPRGTGTVPGYLLI